MAFFKNKKISSITITTTDNHTADETCPEKTKTITPEEASSLAIEPFPQEKTEEKKEEEWVWVEGYKGTDKNMKCRDFQFEIGREYSLLEDQDPIMCTVGFHLCLNLFDVFNYYDIGKGNRFFKVRALVLKKDAMKYGDRSTPNYTYKIDKLVSKSIIFIEELSADEIFKDTDIADFPLEYKEFALKNGTEKAQKKFLKDRLTTAYGDKLAYYIVEHKDIEASELANALADNNDLTLYEKLSLIFGINNLKCGVSRF